MSLKYLVFISCCLTLLVGCRGTTMEEPPIHPNLNMDFQNRYDPQAYSPFFADGRAMRTPVEGTVARGELEEGTPYTSGLDADSNLVERIPRVDVDEEFVRRGQGQFNTYCQPCHGYLGDGNGIVGAQYWQVPVTSFHIERLRDAPDGHIYQVIADGIRTMPSYASQVGVRDRWAIVSYVRALQHSQSVPLEEIPPKEMAEQTSGDDQASSSQ